MVVLVVGMTTIEGLDNVRADFTQSLEAIRISLPSPATTTPPLHSSVIILSN